MPLIDSLLFQLNYPLVSIIIPVFNSEKYISETIKSVLTQTYSQFELLIINDGSTDRTIEIVNNFMSDKRINLINKNNEGVSSARNEGIKHAKGKYIALLDSDDIWHKDNLMEKVMFLENSEDYLFVYSDMIAFTESGDETFHKGYEVEKLWTPYLNQKNLPIPGACSNLVFRNTGKYYKNFYFDKNLSTAADQDFVVSLSLEGKGKHIPKPLWKYRVVGTGMSKNISALEKDQLYLINKFINKKLYSGFYQKNTAKSHNYLILAGCFYTNQFNFKKIIMYLFLSLINNPMVVVNRFFNKIGF